MQRLIAICGLWLALACAGFAEKLPPKPANYFNDLAGVVSAQTASGLDEKLRQFERDTSNQIVVAVFPKLETESSVQDYTYRIAESWAVGQKDRRNGAVLFVFVADHKMFIQVGYGLEGALPDVVCKRIISDEIAPAFKAGKYDAGLTAGVEAMMKAARGEYQGTGKVAGDRSPARGSQGMPLLMVVGIFIFIIVIQTLLSRGRGAVYGSSGRGFATGLLWGVLGNMGSGSGGSSRGGDGGFGGGGGGFSGGGGSFGGGGAGGDW